MRKKYINPIGNIDNIGDPFVLKHDKKYYLYATSMPKSGFKVWKSLNLIDWRLRGVAFDSNLEPNKWGTGDFWAPEVIYFEEKFYMVYSARDVDGHLKIALAVSEDPLGPFKNIKAPLFESNGFSWIDGHIFIDNDQTPYLFFVKDCSENVINGKHVSQIYVQKMSKDLLNLSGSPIMILEPNQQWEGINKEWQWNEGPFVIKHNKLYYLMYSANFYASSDYSIGYAIAKDPIGPWEKNYNNPIITKDLRQGISGPGHNSITTSLDNTESFIVYHTHKYPDSPNGNRVLNIDRIYFENKNLKIIGPTRTFQPFPSGNY
ncbi:MAG: glycoside hydrolase family 43 protein [Nitrososphaeria archaeon]|nr:glycoside hydrolase family 43 protein [Candidatus Jingweiarchaeum tengchongense]MCW1306211.1 glycoside hydrolase family 43 protein [Candidatus Jingweiarchaeum tengchongense]